MKKIEKQKLIYLFIIQLVSACAFPVSVSKPSDSYYAQFESNYFAYSHDWKKRVIFEGQQLNDSISFMDSTKNKIVKLIYVHGVKQGEKEKPEICDSKEQRSTEEILKVIRKETPNGLRVIYNKFLYRDRTFGGKVTVKIYIMKNGSVFCVLPIGDSTANPQFVNALLLEVLDWKFSKANCNSYDIVTVPFTFSP